MTQLLPTRYGSIAQTLHWITAILVLLAFVLGPEGSEQSVYLSNGDFKRQLHETLGLCVFLLSVLRVFWRMVDANPTASPMPRRMEIASKAVQGALYVLLFAVPVTAILGAWLEGHPLTLVGGFLISPQVALSHDLGASIARIHGLLGDAILWLAGAHAAAAIYHHVVLKDRVLSTMLPGWLPFQRKL